MSHSTSMPSAAKKPSCCATKSFRPMPFGATRTLRMIPPSEPIGYTGTGEVVGLLFGDRAGRGVAVQAAQLQARQEYPAAAEVVRPLDAERAEQRPAVARAVIRADPLAGGVGVLPEDCDQRAVPGVDADGGAQVDLRAVVRIEVVAPAREQRDRGGADLGVPFQVHAERSTGIEIGAVIALLEGELRADVEVRRDLAARAALQDSLRGAGEQVLAVVAHDRDRLQLLLRAAVVLRPRAHARAEQGAERIARQGVRGECGGGKSEEQDQ